MQDLLYKCAKSYTELEDYEYTFKCMINNEVKSIKLTFSDSEFKHLTGIEKLKDIPQYSDMRSSQLIKSIYPNQKVFLVNLENSNMFANAINHYSPNNISYCLSDRFLQLQSLKSYLHNANNHNIELFKWDRNTNSSNRPNSSEISADYLICFKETYNKKIDSQTTCSFFIEEKNNRAVGVSIFPTDISYSDDGSIKLKQIGILSVEEYCKSTKQKTVLYQCSEEEMKKAENIAKSQKINKMIHLDLKDLKSKRKKFCNAPDNEALRTKYENRLNSFGNSDLYDDEMLSEVLSRLESQLDDPHNSDVSEMIKNEIAFVSKQIKQRNAEKSLGEVNTTFAIVKTQTNPNGTKSMKKIAEISKPQGLDKIKRSFFKGVHIFRMSVINFAEDVKNVFFKSEPPKKSHKPVQKRKSEHKAVTCSTSIQKQENNVKQPASVSIKETKKAADRISRQPHKHKEPNKNKPER